MQYYFFSDFFFFICWLCCPAPYTCWRNDHSADVFHLNYEINWWCDLLFVYPESRGGNEDKRSKIPAWLEDLLRKKKQLFVYIKEGNHHGTTSFRTQQGKFIIFSCVCVLHCSWYTCTCFSCTDEIWIIWKEWSQWCGRIPALSKVPNQNGRKPQINLSFFNGRTSLK